MQITDTTLAMIREKAILDDQPPEAMSGILTKLQHLQKKVEDAKHASGVGVTTDGERHKRYVGLCNAAWHLSMAKHYVERHLEKCCAHEVPYSSFCAQCEKATHAGPAQTKPRQG